MTIFLRVALISIIPGLAFLPATTTQVSNWIYDTPTTDEIETIRYFLYVLGSLSILVFNYRAQNYRKKIKNRLNDLNSVHRLNLDAILRTMAQNLNVQNDFKIRVFKVRSSFWYGDLRSLENINIESITDIIRGTAPLIFEVDAEKVEGVVGVCLKKGTFFADFDTSNNNQYVLTQEQINKIGEVKFCCALPIITNGKVKHVVSMDLPTPITENQNNKEIVLKSMKELCVYFDAFILKQ